MTAACLAPSKKSINHGRSLFSINDGENSENESLWTISPARFILNSGRLTGHWRKTDFESREEMETILTILAVAGGCVMTAAICIIICACGTALSWLGHAVVRILSFGRIDLEWQSNSESYPTCNLGLFFLFFVSGLIAWVIHG